jgi:acyl carrier protein
LESIDIINVLFELEDEFNIEIPDQDMENARTVGDIVTYVQKKVSTPVTNSEATSSTTG